MNDIEICKKCIYYEYAMFGHCQLTGQLCINNCEFIATETVINNCEFIYTETVINDTEK